MSIDIGGIYRHRDHPEYGYAKAVEVIPARTGINKHGYKIVKVQWSQNRDFAFGLIKHFKQSDLVKESLS